MLHTITAFAKQEGYDIIGLTHSPITGGDGNIEFLLHLRWEGKEVGENRLTVSPEEVVVRAHDELKENNEHGRGITIGYSLLFAHLSFGNIEV